MVDLSVQGIVKAFEEGNNILDGLTFDISEGEHVGLLGKNGAGKTTLFRLIVGELEPDEGDIVIPAGKKIGLISQIPNYPPEFLTEDVLRSAFSGLDAVKKRMEELERGMGADARGDTLSEYDKLAFEFERSGGYDIETRLNTVSNGLQIPLSRRGQLFSTLSGGEKTRVNLARLILESTDILLLDEPTNHLDMRATEWLEDYIARYKGTVLAISHDRYFLDRVAARTIEIVDGRAEFYSGNYSFYVQEKERRYLEQLKKYEREQSEVKRLQEAADRLHQWGTGNERLMKKSRAIQSRAARLAQTERPDRDKKLTARFGESAFRGDDALVLRGVSKSYEGRALFSDVELTVRAGERIALIGDNGAGKTTLLRLIMGEERADTGVIRRGPAVKMAYLPQIIRFGNPYRSLLDTLVYEGNCLPQTARNRLGAFGFTGENVFKLVSELSGGEQSRLRLCVLMRDEINFLILDEPTNHLDIASREWIEDAVSAYGETLLFVSHDRYFIDRFATRIWEIEGGKVTDFQGTFEQYRGVKAQSRPAVPESKAQKTAAQKERPRKKGTPSAQKEVRRLEREIEELESRLRGMDEKREAYASDYEKLMELDAREAEIRTELDGKYQIWAELSDLG